MLRVFPGNCLDQSIFATQVNIYMLLDIAVVSKQQYPSSPTTTSEIYAYAQAICALSGAWIGAIVLPLDWDREWQAWPISCVISTYVGHSVGVLAAFVWASLKLMFGKKKSE